MRRAVVALCLVTSAFGLAARVAASTPEEDLAAIAGRLDAQDQEIARLRDELATRGAAPASDPSFEQATAAGVPYDFPLYLSALPEEAAGAKKEGAGKPAEPPAAAAAAAAAAAKPAPPPFPVVKVTGFMHFDSGWFSQDANSTATVGDLQDGMGFRRARLAAVGQVAEFTNYWIEMDFATAGRPSFQDVWVEQGNLPFLGNVRVGQYRQPFSADALTSIRALPFLERSLPFQAFVPFRRPGAMAWNLSEDQMTQWAYGVYRTGGFNDAPLGDGRFASDIGDTGGYSVSTRATHCLWYDEPTQGRYLMTLGGSYAYAQIGANDATAPGAPFYQARAIPEFFLGYPENFTPAFGPATAANGTPFFIDTGRYAANNFNLFGLESIYQAGAFSAQAEWMGTIVDSVGAGPIFYNGAYAQALYRLTGENRVYDPKTGTLKNPIPYEEFFSLRPGGVQGWGAWEVGSRWSYVNLRNPAGLTYLAGTNASGTGDLNNITSGVTWFWNPGARWQFNWIHSMLDNTVRGNSTAELFVARMQFDF